jgi:TnpA family transposase
MRLKASIEAGTVVPSVILRKLAAAGAGNALARALRALGRIERTSFTLQWLSDPTLRQRSHAGLNKGEASNALRRAVFFHRQGLGSRSLDRRAEFPRFFRRLQRTDFGRVSRSELGL